MNDDNGGAGNPFGGFPFGNLGDMSNLFGGGDPWSTARQVAGSVASGGTTENNVDPAARIAFEQLARVAELHVANATGLAVGDGTPPTIRPATRDEWAKATIDAWRPLLERVGTALTRGIEQGAEGLEGADLDLNSEALAAQGFDPAALGLGPDFMAQIMKMIGPMMLSMTAGSMVGQLARVALGAYVLPLPRPGVDELLVSHANIESFTAEWSVPAEDVSLWLCLHEYLHHAVLRIPHIRDRITELTNDYVSSFESGSATIADRLGAGFDPSNPESMGSIESLMNDPEALFGVVQSERQVAMLPEISALVAAIVGWVDHMMDRTGSQLIGSYSMLSEALRRRRVTASPTNRFVERMLGLELDQACYDRGRDFVDGVVARAGEEALSLLWADVANLPTPNDIVAPGLWLARLGVEYDLESLEAGLSDSFNDADFEEEE